MNAPAVPVVVPPVELTDDTVAEFQASMSEPMQADGPGIVLDLEHVTFISSAGLGCLVKMGMRLDGGGRRLALARPDKNIERSLRLIGLHTQLPMFPSITAATSHITDPAPTRDF